MNWFFKYVLLAIFVVSLVLLEFGSWIVVEYPDRKVARDSQKVTDEQAKETTDNTADQETAIYSSDQVSKDFETREKLGMEYEYLPLLVFGNKEFQSQTVNILADGTRANGTEPESRDGDPYKIYFIGNSTVFGASNGDTETVPAYLEQRLNALNDRNRVSVVNLGVVGYTSIQDFISFQKRLFRDKPDMIIVMNGINDHFQSWMPGLQEKDGVYVSRVGVDVLKHNWDRHHDQPIVNWDYIASGVKKVFSNLFKLINYGSFWFELREAKAEDEIP